MKSRLGELLGRMPSEWRCRTVGIAIGVPLGMLAALLALWLGSR